MEYQVEFHDVRDGDVNSYIKKRLNNTLPEIWRVVSVVPAIIKDDFIKSFIVTWSIEVPKY